MVGDELDAVGEADGASEPDDQTEDANGGNEHHPEPEEQVDLLVIEVDGQDALDGVRLDVAEVLAADAEVAEGDAREGDVALLRPVVVVDHLANEVDAEGAVLGVKNRVEQKQLDENVRDVTQLRKEEQQEKIIPEPKTTSHVNDPNG